MKKLILILFLLPFSVLAQKEESDGVHFIHSVSNWSDIVKKAQKEDKYIFVDCYTTWCGPCKYLANEIFPKATVGAFYNKNFVCIGLQMDETSKDDKDIIESRIVANSINEEYKIDVYPTFLVFNKAGILVHKFSGAGNDSMMIKKAQAALNENQQYYTLYEKYNEGNRDTILLKNLIKTSQDVRVKPDVYLLTYLQSIQNLFTNENGNLLIDNAQSTKSICFDYLFSNIDTWKGILNTKKLNDCFFRLIIQEIYNDNSFEYKNQKIKPAEIIQNYSKMYFDAGKRAALFYLLNYYNETRKSKYIKSLLMNYEEFDGSVFINASQMNSYAWNFFQEYDDLIILNKALSWSKKSLEKDQDNPAYLDTYANLLYKLGITEDATEIETKALTLVKDSEKKKYQETLDKMKAGKPTWK